uniref:Uncharacterized protein n=1 Tax=Romanomermis culicivorax TaxID=13658 RepID=A0A915IAE1_ROMCU
PEKRVEPAPSTPTPSTPAPPQPQAPEQRSESSSSSESSTTETAGQLTNVIAQIVQDAQNPERAKQHEELRQTSIDDMIKMSRNEPDTFDRIISENTKDSLFVTQPTHDEWRAWQGSGGGEIRAKNWTDEIDLADAQVSSKTFCCSTACNKPRHANYPHAKKPA